jgi:hypothetical protein
MELESFILVSKENMLGMAPVPSNEDHVVVTTTSGVYVYDVRVENL